MADYTRDLILYILKQTEKQQYNLYFDIQEYKFEFLVK